MFKKVIGVVVALVAVVSTTLLVSHKSTAEPVQQVQPSENVGSVTSPFSYSRQYGENGIITQPVRMNTPSVAALATTTICSIQSPTQGTSSLQYASVQLSVSSTSASIIDIGKASNTGATTTLLASTMSVAANAQVTISASSTNPSNIFSPGQYLNVNMKGGANNAFYPTGVCIAKFRALY